MQFKGDRLLRYCTYQPLINHRFRFFFNSQLHNYRQINCVLSNKKFIYQYYKKNLYHPIPTSMQNVKWFQSFQLLQLFQTLRSKHRDRGSCSWFVVCSWMKRFLLPGEFCIRGSSPDRTHTDPRACRTSRDRVSATGSGLLILKNSLTN